VHVLPGVSPVALDSPHQSKDMQVGRQSLPKLLCECECVPELSMLVSGHLIF